MTALPNLQVISNALKDLSTEVPNIPVFLNVIASLETTAKKE
jgi:hypothetical protein